MKGCESFVRVLLLTFAVALLQFRPLAAQEMKLSVQINSQKIQGTNRNVFMTMQSALYEFVNSTQWTNLVMSENERIEGSMIITLNEQLGSDEYKGTLNLQLRRPIYGTSYNSPLLNFLDNNIQFKYIENEKLEFSESAHVSNLISIVAYYVYIILGYDSDTFAPLGGTEFFEKAERIVNNAQSAPERGWKAYEGSKKNRYWIVQNMLSDKYRGLRRAMYTIHRRGFDVMADKLSEGRAQVLQGLVEVQKVYRSKPDPDMLALQLFLDSKRDEMVALFSEAPSTERAKAVNILVEIDRVNAERYQAILKKQQ